MTVPRPPSTTQAVVLIHEDAAGTTCFASATPFRPSSSVNNLRKEDIPTTVRGRITSNISPFIRSNDISAFLSLLQSAGTIIGGSSPPGSETETEPTPGYDGYGRTTENEPTPGNEATSGGHASKEQSVPSLDTQGRRKTFSETDGLNVGKEGDLTPLGRGVETTAEYPLCEDESEAR